MATLPDPANGKRIVDRVLRDAGEEPTDTAAPSKPTPMYAVKYDSRIPVSSSTGKLWKSRWESAARLRGKRQDDKAWSEAVSYFRNDQTPNRGGPTQDGYVPPAGRDARTGRETENVVFANATALVPSIYAKTPTVEVTPVDQADEPIAQVCERLVNQLMSMKAAPGIGMKSKARRCVLSAVLKNVSYIEVGYTFREQSSEQALAEMQTLGEELQNAKTPQEITDIEGKLMALEKRIDFLTPAGPWAKFRTPEDVLRDPDCIEEDGSDARWMMVHDYVPTEFINAVYTEKRADGQRVLIAQPTHVVTRGGAGGTGQNDAEVDVASFTLLTEGNGAEPWKANGYDDQESYLRAQRTSVWYVWDKVTRRCLMFNEKDWSWPIWVWDDPYKLDRFFPVYTMSFYQDPERGAARGEVTYYLDQQDAINEINRELRKSRAWARRNILYNNAVITRDDADAYMRGDKDVAVGIELPDGQKLSDHVFSQPPPSMAFIQLFDKKPVYDAIDRLSSVLPVMRGMEFKTNTTNKAVETYNSSQQTRLDEKIDQVEDLIGDVAYGVMQMCVAFMPPEQVAEVIGDEMASGWTNMPSTEFRKRIQMRVVGGSTEKPTSKAKKEMALELGQVLGQFASATPAVVPIMLKAVSRAFNEVVITDQDWQMVMQSLQQSMQPDPTAQPSGGTQDAGAQAQGQTPSIDQLPPEAQAAVQDAVSKGVPADQAIARVVQLMQSQQGAA